MKKSFILLVAFAAMVFASCSKDDDDPSNEVGSITMTLDEVDIDFVVGTAKDEIITIDWGDGLKQEYKSAMVEKDEKIQYNIIAKHTYSQSGTYPIKISGVVTGLWCEREGLITLDVSNCRSLKELDCYGNELTALDVSNNKALTYLDCGRNELTSLDVSNNKALKYLNCGSNELTSLDMSKCTALTELYCSGNELTSLNVSECTALTDFGCRENKLTALDVSKCTALTRLICDYNSLSSDALNKIFNDLPKGEDYEYQPKIYINGNPGAETCNKSIAENKGWKLSTY